MINASSPVRDPQWKTPKGRHARWSSQVYVYGRLCTYVQSFMYVCIREDSVSHTSVLVCVSVYVREHTLVYAELQGALELDNMTGQHAWLLVYTLLYTFEHRNSRVSP